MKCWKCKAAMVKRCTWSDSKATYTKYVCKCGVVTVVRKSITKKGRKQ